MSEVRESKRIRRVLTFIGYNYFDSNNGQKVDLSFIDKNPYKYKGEKSYSYVMTSQWLKQLTDYSKCSLVIGRVYDVLTKYNFEFKTDYIVGIFAHEDNPLLPSFNVSEVSDESLL